jgi:preprotein translocase subunit SecB
LQLKYSVFDQVSVEALLDYVWDDERPEPAVEVGVGQSPEKVDEWAVWLTIEVPQDVAPTPPYAIKLRAFGLFEVAPDFEPEDDTAHVVAVNGASILYSAAREFLLIITGRGPYEHYALPTYDFRKHPFSMIERDQIEQGGAGLADSA